MQTVWTIMHMFPNAKLTDFEVTIWGNGSWEITKWNLTDEQPTQQQIIDHWNANQSAIMAANKPPMDEFAKIKKAHVDLVFQLMNKGVI